MTTDSSPTATQSSGELARARVCVGGPSQAQRRSEKCEAARSQGENVAAVRKRHHQKKCRRVFGVSSLAKVLLE